jgi:choice-of-anchor B domain-containing protein
MLIFIGQVNSVLPAIKHIRFLGMALWLVTLSTAQLAGQGKCISGLVNETWPCHQVEMLAHVPNVMTGGVAANDLWGWTDPVDGREYVLLGKRDGTWMIDITQPSVPRVVGHVSTLGLANSLWRDIKVVGNFMLVVSEVINSRLQVFDLTRLRDHTSPGPAITFSTDTMLLGFSKAHNLATAPDVPMAYVCGANGLGGLLAYDFSDAEAPVIAGSWDEAYVHDAHVVRYHGPDSSHQQSLIAALSCAADFKLVDLTDPQDIEVISSATHQPHGYIHQGWFSPDHRYFFLGDETDETGGLVDQTTTYVWDVTDLENPILVDAVGLGTEGTDHNMYARGDFLCQSNYNDGFRMQVFDPESGGPLLEEKAFFDTQPASADPGFSGTWSNYPYFDSGTIAVSDQSEGLFLVRTTFTSAWPELLSVCPSDTMRILVTIDPCVEGPVSLQLPEGIEWSSTDSLPGPGTWPVEFAGFDWTNMSGVTLRLSGEEMVHACRIFVNVTEDAMHYPDLDGDGYGTFDGAIQGCSTGPNFAHVGGDCDDANANVHPGLDDPCDGVDNDCDQGLDEDGVSLPFYFDIDGDGLAGVTVYSSCTIPDNAFSEPGQDCNDLDATMYPGAPPTLMGVDNDCNGYILGLEQLDGGCAGDFNGDDYVNIQDLLSFLNDFGSTGFLQTDLNFDQHVGSSDLLLMLGLLGTDC